MEDDEIGLRKNEPNYDCPTCGDTGRYRPFDRTFKGIVNPMKDCPWGCKTLHQKDVELPPKNIQ